MVFVCLFYYLHLPVFYGFYHPNWVFQRRTGDLLTTWEVKAVLFLLLFPSRAGLLVEDQRKEEEAHMGIYLPKLVQQGQVLTIPSPT